MAISISKILSYSLLGSIYQMAHDEVPEEVRGYFSRLGRKFGKLGGEATARKLSPAQRKRNAKKASDAAAASMTPEQRKARAKKAAADRWAKAKKQASPDPKAAGKKAKPAGKQKA